MGNNHVMDDNISRLISFDTLMSIMNHVYNGIHIINRANRIVYINQQAADYLGLPLDRALGFDIRRIFPNSHLIRAMESGLIERNHISTFNGKKIIITRIPIESEGKIVAAAALFQNIDQMQENELTVRNRLIAKGHAATYSFAELLYQSDKMGELVDVAKAFATTSSSILIEGESGTGKELFAQSIHNASPRLGAPFVAVNCATLPESILESELFGYAEASFTGAQKGGRPGLFQQAHRGTIFLDEIGEMSLPVQVKLLRVLQEREVRPVGGDRVVPVDVRVICATNKSLLQEVEGGRFRLDLLYRLNVLNLMIPPLRERRGDIPLLARHMLDSISPGFCEQHDKVVEAVISRLSDYEFRGNVRELRNIMERLVLLLLQNMFAGNPDLLIEQIIGNGFGSRPQRVPDSLDDLLAQREKNSILKVLAETDGARPAAARLLGISEATLWRKLKKYKILVRKR